MGRPLIIVLLVGLFLATGVAGAMPVRQVRIPATTSNTSSTPVTVTVAKGDHLWKISARHLGAGSDNGEIAPYWRTVVEVNTPRLRSGDPDLIYPGEVIEMPAVNESR
ncbi:MAG TPA: hypothetical protein VFS66_09420 [Acidimicrobiia bacterium]|nr:hypothetical protein [Acidimicrobiia bacterium]